MNNLFNQSDTTQILERIEKLTPDSQRLWGKMNVAQKHLDHHLRQFGV